MTPRKRGRDSTTPGVSAQPGWVAPTTCPFRRMWEFYLAYCEAGFATGYLDVAQVVLRRTAPD